MCAAGLQPLLVAGGVGLLIAFAFSYLPLQQAQTISPVTLFRSKGLAAPPIDWPKLIFSSRIVPLVLAAAAFLWLAIIMTGDPMLVAAFAIVSVLSVVLFQFGISALLFPLIAQFCIWLDRKRRGAT